MPIIPQDERLDEMRRLRLSEPLIRLAGGEVLHPFLETCYVGPPAYVYGEWEDEDDLWMPGRPPLVPFWSFADTVQGVWEEDGELAFIDLHIEDPDHPEILARTEQGFLAYVFATLHEYAWDEPDELEQLPEVAEIVGYRHYAEWLAAYEACEAEGYDAYVSLRRQFVARIDSLKTSRDRRRW